MDKAENVTLFKRLRGLLKKSIELSKKCDQDIVVFIRDVKNKTMVEFNSSPSFNI